MFYRLPCKYMLTKVVILNQNPPRFGGWYRSDTVTFNHATVFFSCFFIFDQHASPTSSFWHLKQTPWSAVHIYYLRLHTGKHLSEHCRMEYPKPVNYCLWILAEVAVIAADIPEGLDASERKYKQMEVHSLWSRVGYYSRILIGGFIAVIGTAFAINILFHVPIWGGVLLAGLSTLLLLGLQRYGVSGTDQVSSFFFFFFIIYFLINSFKSQSLPFCILKQYEW